MKKFELFALIALAMAACACNKEIEQPGNNGPEVPTEPGKIVFTALAPTKTATTDDQTVTWVAGDEVRFSWDGGYTTATAASSGASTTFTIDAPDDATEIYAIYPASAGGSVSDGKVTVHYSGSRTDGSFEANDICVAKAVKNGDAWETSLAFKNAACILKVGVTSSDIVKIKVEAVGGEMITGAFEVSMDSNGNPVVEDAVGTAGTSSSMVVSGPGNYYIPIKPGVTLTEGFRVSRFIDDENQTIPFYYYGSFTTERGKIIKLDDIDAHAGQYYVTPAGAGTKSGQSWNNAMDAAGFKAFIENTNNYFILRGATFHLSAENFTFGDYLQPDFSGHSETAFTIEGTKSGSDITTFVGGTGSTAGTLWPKASSNVTVKNVKFSGTDGDSNRGAIRVNTSSAKLNLENCVFENNATPGNGGAICLYKGLTTITDCEFTSNSGGLGAAVYAEGETTLNISGSTFTSNTASNNTSDYGGGAIYIKSQGATVAIDDCTFTGNQATNKCGGAICVKGGDGDTALTLSDCTFTNNYAKGWGGAILFKVSGTMDVTDCEFNGNYAGGDSGAVNPDIATCTFTRVSFTGNHANGDCGGVMWAGNGAMTFNDCTFDNNYTVSRGGVIYSYDNGSIDFNNCRFKGNYSTSTNNSYRGGAFAVRKGTLKFNKCTFDSNYGWKGGAICAAESGSTLYLNDCLFTGNYTTGTYGTSIQVNNNGTTLCMNNCTFADNTYCADSGANGKACCWIDLLNTGKFVLSNSTLIGYSRKGDNGATNSGGAALIGWENAAKPVALINNIIAHSNGADKGAFLLRGGTPTITAVSNKMSNFVSVTPDIVSGTNATDFKGSSSYFGGLNYVSASEPAWNNCYWSWNGTLASGSDLTFDTAANIKAAIQAADSDFYSWLETVEGLTKDGRGNARPASGQWWPGAYQN
ncbi:MAG: hypothetical protein IKX37_05255 [Bacteroidales bacterium]|nr:hypothetical protein [Bacteroidales bacterium]